MLGLSNQIQKTSYIFIALFSLIIPVPKVFFKKVPLPNLYLNPSSAPPPPPKCFLSSPAMWFIPQLLSSHCSAPVSYVVGVSVCCLCLSVVPHSAHRPSLSLFFLIFQRILTTLLRSYLSKFGLPFHAQCHWICGHPPGYLPVCGCCTVSICP